MIEEYELDETSLSPLHSRNIKIKKEIKVNHIEFKYLIQKQN